ncbi:MAG: DedA family protein [Candidatus Woesearchaeota archaeon]|jgi:membrane protein DedA with SNARE-associated domain
MNILSQVLVYIGNLSIKIISTLGYFGIVVLMAMESMIVPIPSELVLPFAGFLAAQGSMNFWLVLLFSVIGTVIGSFISYYIGYYGGNKIILKYGKYFLLDEEDLIKTEEWFRKKGEWTIFVSRFIPVVRHIISIPAGIGKMNKWRFGIYTALGGAMWNAILIYAGYWLGKNWAIVRQKTELVSIIVVILLVLGVIYFVYKHVVRKNKYALRKKVVRLEKELKYKSKNRDKKKK